MLVGVNAAELLTYKAVEKDGNEKFAQSAYHARYFAIRTGERICIDVNQLHGDYGYSKDLGVEVLLRDVKGLFLKP